MENKKGDVEIDTLIYWIVGVAAFVLVLVGLYFLFKGSGLGAVRYIKNLFKFKGVG